VAGDSLSAVTQPALSANQTHTRPRTRLAPPTWTYAPKASESVSATVRSGFRAEPRVGRCRRESMNRTAGKRQTRVRSARWAGLPWPASRSSWILWRPWDQSVRTLGPPQSDVDASKPFRHPRGSSCTGRQRRSHVPASVALVLSPPRPSIRQHGFPRWMLLGRQCQRSRDPGAALLVGRSHSGPRKRLESNRDRGDVVDDKESLAVQFEALRPRLVGRGSCPRSGGSSLGWRTPLPCFLTHELESR
jgi:hypothetical protein